MKKMETQNFTNKTNKKALFVNGAWNLANTLLWPTKTFNEVETDLVKAEISKLILTDSFVTTRANYIAFCERVIMAYQFITRDAKRFAPHPLKYFSPYFEHGFAGTNDWYMDVLHERCYIIVHRFDMRVLAESYCNYLFKSNKETFITGKEALANYASAELMQAYNNIIINHNYNN
jgi:hypothetical protein